MSARRIIGFACNQAFVFFLFYMGVAQSLDVGGYPIERVELIFMLLFMVVGFSLVRIAMKLSGPNSVPRLFARPLLYIYAVIAAVGAMLPVLVDNFWVEVIGQGALVGLSCSLLLTAWGRAFGCESTRTSIPEVFLGSLAAALICLVFSLGADMPIVRGAVCLLPLASVVNIEIPAVEESASAASVLDTGESEARVISAKILAGTVLFGMAAGIVESSGGANMPGVAATPFYQVSLVLFGAFLIGGLTLLLSDGFGRGAALNKSYRLAVFIMMMGVLIVPWPLLAASPLPGESIVLAGYLALEAVLISLFLVIAEITDRDCALSFSTGFLSLFAGELIGCLLPDVLPSYVLAGGIVLLSYFFLFTERDFDTLSEIVSVADSFENTCAAITERYALSKRESEILAYALRGRTSERIASELVISKSTVDTHLRRIYAKCGVHSRQELLDLAGL